MPSKKKQFFNEIDKYFKRKTVSIEKFRSHFGVSKATGFYAYLVASSKQSDVEPIHIFWVLYFLKHYPTNEEASHHFGVDTKTYTKWLWRVLFILFIYLNEVNFRIRKVNKTDHFWNR